MAMPLLRHDWVGSLHTIDDSQQVDGDDLVPMLELEIPSIGRHGNAGVIEHIVEPLMRCACMLDELVHSVEIGHIDRMRRCLPAVLANGHSNGLGPFSVNVRDNHLGPADGKGLAKGLANPRSAASNDSYPVLKSGHCTTSACAPRVCPATYSLWPATNSGSSGQDRWQRSR